MEHEQKYTWLMKIIHNNMTASQRKEMEHKRDLKGKHSEELSNPTKQRTQLKIRQMVISYHDNWYN